MMMMMMKVLLFLVFLLKIKKVIIGRSSTVEELTNFSLSLSLFLSLFFR